MKFVNSALSDGKIFFNRYLSDKLEWYLSEEGEESTWKKVTARFGRGNTVIQNGDSTTEQQFKKELSDWEQSAERRKSRFI